MIMAEKISDVLKAAKLLTAKGNYQTGDIKIVSYPEEKVRVYGVTSGNLPDVLLAGDAHSDDAAGAKKATDYFTQAKIDAMLKAVVGLAESAASEGVKPTAPAAAPSS